MLRSWWTALWLVFDLLSVVSFFFQAEDGIRDIGVTGVQTCALPICSSSARSSAIPAVRIRDWPAMKWRGVHDDISRGPVPNMDFIKEQIRTEAEYKLNMHSLYIEHVFDYAQNPLIGPEEGSLSPAQIKELVDYGKRYYVTILPEQQAFGHLHHVLKWELYDELGETPHGHVLA